MGILPGFGKTAFHGLFDHCALQHDWTLVPEWGKRCLPPPLISKHPWRSTLLCNGSEGVKKLIL